MSGEYLAGRRVIVTGGCGFIGGHLVDRLLKIDGTSVTVIDDCRFGSHFPKDAGVRYKLIRHHLGSDSLEKLKLVMARNDIVFHLAAEKLHQSQDDLTSLKNSNIQGTSRLLEAASSGFVSRIIIASSLYAHGRMAGPALREDDRPEPATLYGQTKLAGETLLSEQHRANGLLGAALRFFFVYGPRQYSGIGYKSIITKNFQRLAQGHPPAICGDGQQALDYIYIDDVIRALILAAECDLKGEVINIGSGQAVSILDLTQRMQKVAGTNYPPEFIERDFTAGTCRYADIKRAKEKLVFTAETSLDKGLEATWSWVKKEFDK